MKIASIVGARPQFIKAAMVSKVIRKNHTEVLIHTGQHYDEEMSQVFFDVMGIPEPEHNLNIGSGNHASQTALMLEGIAKLLRADKPDWVIVYGDTNSTLAGALAAVKLHLPIAHVEAGLRSYNMDMPEEVNRRVTDHLSKLLFCPTEQSLKNLENEGIADGVHLVGDVMYDAVKHYGRQDTDILQRLDITQREYDYLTVHRPVNTDDETNLRNILSALSDKVIFPAHPRTIKSMKQFDLKPTSNIEIIKPVHYLDSLTLIKNARKVITDSGGMQKEAYFLGVPCITLREETEWTETVEDGWNVLTGADPKKIIHALETFEPTGKRQHSYGDGNAGEKIVNVLEDSL